MAVVVFTRSDVHQSLFQPLKCNPLTAHEALELAKLQVVSYVGIK